MKSGHFSQNRVLMIDWLKNMGNFSQIPFRKRNWLKFFQIMLTNPVILQPIRQCRAGMAEKRRIFQPKSFSRTELAETSKVSELAETSGLSEPAETSELSETSELAEMGEFFGKVC